MSNRGMTRIVASYRNWVLLLMAGVILGIVNFQIVAKERIVAGGVTVLLQLAPRDPRSLIQGDYMALRYAMAPSVATAAKKAGVSDGQAVIRIGDQQVARFEDLYDGGRLAPQQHLLRFRKRGGSVRLAGDAFFFEEGRWDTYSSARYGELRVGDNGDAVLTGLRDGDFKRLGVALH